MIVSWSDAKIIVVVMIGEEQLQLTMTATKTFIVQTSDFQ